MALRAVEHTFTGATNHYSATYDSTKTTLGDLIKQYTGPTPKEKYAGPIRFGRDAALTTYYGVARPNETATQVPGIYPHAVTWADKHGYYSTGTVSVSETVVTGSGTGWFADGVPIGATIGFGSTDPGAITTWYTISTIASDTSITLQSSAGTITAGTSFVINKDYERDWVFLADNATAAATRRITLFEFDRLTSNFSWRGFVTLTYPTATNHTIQGLKIAYKTYTTGTVAVASSNNYSTGTVTVAATAVTGSGTTFTSGMVGMSIGFYTTNPALVSQWYVISAFTSGTAITLAATAGTVAAGTSYVIATTTVTGTGTTWSSDRIIVGSRIGFGSTDPNQIYRWHYVSALTATTVVTSDTAFYIQSTPTANGIAGVTSNVTYSSGTAYVIEDVKILTSTTNATATNGGLYMAQGISYNDFTVVGTTIVAAASTDKVKAVYWLADASTVTNDVARGLVLDDYVSMTSQFCYVLEAASSTSILAYKYNFRVALGAPTSGKVTTAFVLATGAQTIATNISTYSPLTLASMASGGSGTKSLYFNGIGRIHRAAVSGVTSGNTSWITDTMTEVPTGNSAVLTSFAASGVLANTAYLDQADRLVVTIAGPTGTNVANSYVTQFSTVANTAFDRFFGYDTRQVDISTINNSATPLVGNQGAPLTTFSTQGLTYLARNANAGNVGNYNLYALPLGADWDFANGTVKQRLITPSIATTNAAKLIRVVVNNEEYMGDGGLRIPMEGYRLYYRTSGITDDSGSWTLVDSTGDLSAATPASTIQFMFEFRTIGAFCIPARIYSVSCLYEDSTTDSHYQPSTGLSSITGKRFAWRFATRFGGTVPKLRIRLYDAIAGTELVNDDSVTQSGTWEKSTNGGSSWSSYDSLDKINETTYIRYTRTGLSDDISVRALLTQF
jgi:hypothetical protein